MPKTTDQRLDAVESRLTGVETRLTGVETGLENLQTEVTEFKNEMTVFKGEIYEFRDEMYDFGDTFNDYATQTERRFQTIEQTMEEGFKLVLAQFDLLAYQIKSDFRAVMREHERTYHGVK